MKTSQKFCDCRKNRLLALFIVGSLSMSLFSLNSTDYLLGNEDFFEITQSSSITGIVIDEKSEPLIGVTVKSKTNPELGTITNMDGAFSINVAPSTILEISYMGYKSQEVKAKEGMRIMLVEDLKSLSEVVVVGYGVQKKVNVTGSIGTIDSGSLQDRPNTNLLNTAQGQVAGVTIITRPGATPTINFRGRGTTGGASEPLYVIDGIISDATFFSRLDPTSIKSISFLKDAASSAIYGSRAAYGVVLVETVQGSEGKPIVTYNGYVGIKRATYRPKVLGADWYVGLQAEGIYNDAVLGGSNPDKPNIDQIRNDYMKRHAENPDLYPNTNWFDLVLDNEAVVTQHSLNFRGGDAKTKYNASVGYTYDNSFVPGEGTNRYNLATSLSSDIKQWLTLRTDVKYILYKNKRRGSVSYLNMLYVPSTFVAKHSNGEYGTILNGVETSNYTTANPLRNLEQGGWRNINNGRTSITLAGDIKPIKNLVLTGEMNYYANDYKSKTFDNSWDQLVGFTSNNPIPSSDRRNEMKYDWNSSARVIYNGLARYNFDVAEKNHFGALLGTAYEYMKYEKLEANRKNFPNNEMTNITGGSTAEGDHGNKGEYYQERLLSYFGRLTYNFDEKYLFEMNMRADASSRFHKDNRWGYFPSFSAGWRISQEEFMKKIDCISNLKLRGSWGKLGNIYNVGRYDYFSTYLLGGNYNFEDKQASGVYPSSPANDRLSWEKVTITDIGFDLDLFQGRTGITFDYYNKATNDILIKYNAANEVGISDKLAANMGSVRNRGFELALRYGQTFGDFSFDISGNISKNWNKVIYMGPSNPLINDMWITTEGSPIGSFYVYKTDGLYTQEEIDRGDYTIFGRKPIAGDIKYVKTSGEGNEITGDDRIASKSDVPNLTYGVSLNVGYKDFDLAVSGYGVGGVYTYFSNEMAIAFFNSASPREYHLGRWTEDNPDPNAVYPRLYTGSGQTYNNRQSDFWLFNSSYFRIKNITLGYSVPPVFSQRYGVNSLKLYFAVENPFTIRADKRMKDFDPETASGRGQNSRGTQIYTFGVNVSF